MVIHSLAFALIWRRPCLVLHPPGGTVLTLPRTAPTGWKGGGDNQIKICHRVLTRTWSSGGTLVAAVSGENKRQRKDRRENADTTCRERSCATAQHLSGGGADWKNQIKICHRVLTRTWSSGGTLVAAVSGENKRQRKDRRENADTTCRERSCATAQHLSGGGADWKNQIKICHRVLTRTWSSGGTLVAAVSGENKRQRKGRRENADTICRVERWR